MSESLAIPKQNLFAEVPKLRDKPLQFFLNSKDLFI